jgi:hypothetical protein
MTDNIKLLKLVTGEDLLAELLNEGKDHLSVKNAIRVVLVPNRPGADPKSPTVGFAPWAEFAEDGTTIQLDKRHVVAVLTPIREFVNQYKSIFSKVIMPQAKLFIPGE